MADIEIDVTQNSNVVSVGGLSSLTAGTGLLANGTPGGTLVGSGTIAADLAPNGGGTANQLVRATDSRLSDARTPALHASSHASGGSDPVTLAQTQVVNLVSDLAAKVPTTRLVTAGTALTGGGALSTDVTLNVDLAPSGGGSATQAVSATDTRLSNARTPTSHGGTHGSAGTDPIPAGGLAQSQVANLTTDLAQRVPLTRQVIAGTGLTGGGDLTANVTLSCDFAASGSATVGKPVEATDSRLNDARTPTGAASGDLAGTYPGPTVDGLAGVQLNTAAPSSGDVWQFNGGQWDHVAPSTLTTNAGTFATRPIDASTPAANDVWQYNGSQWTHVLPTTLATSASLANYIPTPGSVTRSVTSRLNETVSVKNFGAVGDGVVDDTTAIQAALNSGAKRVVVPEGTYRIVSTLVIPSEVTFSGTSYSSVIFADNVTGPAITSFSGSWVGTYRTRQVLQDFTISGTCTHGVLWCCNYDTGIYRVHITATCTNGFIVDGCFSSVFRELKTNGPGANNISNACLWMARDFIANVVDHFHTSNYCNSNVLCTIVGISAISPYSGSVLTCQASLLNTPILQGGLVGLDLQNNASYGGLVINAPFFENVVLPIKLGDAATSQLCRSVVINAPNLLGPATAISHPSGPSVVGIDIQFAVDITFNSLEFGAFGDVGPPATDCIHYISSHKVVINNFYLSAGGLGSILTDKIKRKAGADTDGGIFVIGEELDSVSGSRAHFLLMKSQDFSYQHYKMAVNASGAWVSTSVIPPLYP